jgi:hypothetical protein
VIQTNCPFCNKKLNFIEADNYAHCNNIYLRCPQLFEIREKNNQILFLNIVSSSSEEIKIDYDPVRNIISDNEFYLNIKDQEYILPIDFLTLPITKDNIKEIIFKVEKLKCFQ